MKYLITAMICIVVASAAVVFAADQNPDTPVVDRGYECFNLEIAQAQLSYVQEHGGWGQVWSARRTVKNWEKLCK